MNRLKEIRKEKKLTLNQLSNKIGIPRATLSRYENGTSEPKQETWEQIANFYSVSTAYLMGVSDQRMNSEYTLSLAKEIYRNLLNHPEKVDEKEFKALKYYEDKNIDEYLKEIIGSYLSRSLILKNKKLLYLEDTSWLESDISYQLWEKYRMEHKTNQNLIDNIYYSLPIDEDVIIYKDFDTIHKKTIDKNNSIRIQLATYLFENSIDRQLETELVEIIEDAYQKIRNLRDKYPDKPSDIRQVTQAFVYDNTAEHSELFWKRVDEIDIVDETNLTEKEKQELIKIASEMFKENN